MARWLTETEKKLLVLLSEDGDGLKTSDLARKMGHENVRSWTQILRIGPVFHTLRRH